MLERARVGTRRPYPGDGGDEAGFLVAPHHALVRADAQRRAGNLRAVVNAVRWSVRQRASAGWMREGRLT